MLDVHAPEHPIHGIRDFFIHLFTITVGLLIALGLENVAEWRHHVHLRHEAETTMRREIEANRKDLFSVIQSIPDEQKGLKVIATFLQGRLAGQQAEVRSMRTGMVDATLQDASWNTAQATGALSYMEYGEVQRFAGAYQMQKKFEDLQGQALPSIVSIMAYIGTEDPTKLSLGDSTAALHDVRLSQAHLVAIRDFGEDLDKLYAEALKDE